MAQSVLIVPAPPQVAREGSGLIKDYSMTESSPSTRPAIARYSAERLNRGLPSLVAGVLRSSWG